MPKLNSNSLNINTLDREIRQLPSLSVIINQLLALLQQKNVSMSVLMQRISQDQALTVRILQIANSPFYGMSTHISSLKDAGVILGLHTLQNIITAAGIIGHFPPAKDDSFDRLSFWQHAIGTGICAQVLARQSGLDADQAFTAGLLHDLGKLVFATYFRDDFARVLEWRDQHDCLIKDAEQAVMGFDHTVIGAKVAQHWKLPKAVVITIRCHHTPSDAFSSLTGLVHLGDILCRGLEIGHGGDNLMPTLDPTTLQRLGLDWASIHRCLKEIETLNSFSTLLLKH